MFGGTSSATSVILTLTNQMLICKQSQFQHNPFLDAWRNAFNGYIKENILLLEGKKKSDAVSYSLIRRNQTRG